MRLSEWLIVCFTEVSKEMDHHIRAVTICHSLALLVSQSSPEDFAVRLALLTALQKCWLSGHLILKLECSCDGAITCISDVIVDDVNTSITSDTGIQSTDDLYNLLDVQTGEQCDNLVTTSDFAIELKSECLHTAESLQEKSLVPTDGSEPVYCNTFSVLFFKF